MKPGPHKIDGDAVVKEALQRMRPPARRILLQRSVTLGGLSMLTGCSLADGASVEQALMKVSRWNDEVQAWLFDPDRLAPPYRESMSPARSLSTPFIAKPRCLRSTRDYRLEITGLVADKLELAA